MFEEHQPYYYMSVYQEQQELMRNYYDLDVLRMAMKAFISLQEVHILAIMVHRDIVLRNLASSFDNWEFIDCKWIPACRHAVETTLTALRDAKSPVTALCSPTLSPQSLLQLSPKSRQIAASTWKQLTHLEVTFDERPDRSYLDTSGTILTGPNAVLSELFKGLLDIAHNLTTLFIRFTPGTPVRLPLRDVFHDTQWPKLRVLGIGSWMIHSDELIEIIRRHGSTLQGFRLNEIYLLDGDWWKDVVVAIKEYVMGIQWVGLHEISYEREYVQKQAYIETYSDTSSDNDEDLVGSYDDNDLLSLRSRESNTSRTTAGDILQYTLAGGDDIVYGNVFTTSSSVSSTATTATTIGHHHHGNNHSHGPELIGPSSVQDGSNHSRGLHRTDGRADGESEEDTEDLVDDGRTVSQAQRRYWEEWILGKKGFRGENYTCSL
jgi:hypothetical protein